MQEEERTHSELAVGVDLVVEEAARLENASVGDDDVDVAVRLDGVVLQVRESALPRARKGERAARQTHKEGDLRLPARHVGREPGRFSVSDARR